MKRNKNFSLTELIILIVIIVVLIALWLPALFKTKSNATTTSCAGNIKQSVTGILLYAATNDGVICTSGNKYSGWFSQPGIPENLNFKSSTAGRSPRTERPVTLCPDIWLNSNRNANQAYGAAWFSILPEYGEEYEKVVTFPTNNGQIVYLNKLPLLQDYVLLADSAYTPREAPDITSGAQTMLFVRKNIGQASYFPRAISLRHNGEANIGFGDGHVGNTLDRQGMLMKSKIGAYTDISGQSIVVTK